jgi:hypothetical protein
MYKNIAVHILLISIIIGFSLSSCNNQKKEYMVEGYYNYSSSNEIGEIRNSMKSLLRLYFLEQKHNKELAEILWHLT